MRDNGWDGQDCLSVLFPIGDDDKMTKVHNLGGPQQRDNSHGNRTSWPHRPDSERWPEMSIRKVQANTVPFGESISRNGRTVWAAYHNDRLIAVGATHDEARAKYRTWSIAESAKRAEGRGQKS